MPPPDPKTFTTVLPLNALHARVFAVQGRIDHEKGLPELTVWATNPWDFIRPGDKPPANSEHHAVSRFNADYPHAFRGQSYGCLCNRLRTGR
jgi:hypothetical protein